MLYYITINLVSTYFLYNNIPSEIEKKNNVKNLVSNPKQKKIKIKSVVLNDKSKPVNEIHSNDPVFSTSKNQEKNTNINNFINNNKSINYNYNKRKKKKKLSVRIEKTNLYNLKNSIFINSIEKVNVSDKNNNMGKIQLTFDHLSPVPNKDIDENEFNELPYLTAITYDHRNVFSTFMNIFIVKIEIIEIFCFSEKYTSILLELNKYLLAILLEIFFNAFLFSDDIISQKYHSNGVLDKFTSLFLSTFSKVLSNIIEYLINKLTDIYSYTPVLIRDVKIKKYYLYYVKKILKIMNIKIIWFLIVENIVSLFITYYLFVFCAIYSKSQNSFIVNYFYGAIESLLISFGISLIITTLRMIGLKNRFKVMYDTSKFINKKF